MIVAHVDCIGGAAGNMLLGALLDAGADSDALEASLRTVVPDGWRLERRAVVKRGIAATFADFIVDAEGAHGHGRHLDEILAVVERSELSAPQKTRASAIYRCLAEAEAAVHGTSVEAIHFHEVGETDAILDVAAFCVGLDQLSIERLTCSVIPLGGGTIRMHHGDYPNPPPATARMLLGVPTYDTGIDAELVTTTAAAILRTVCARFGVRDPMTPRSIGYGAGTRDLPRPNVTRITVGVANGATAEGDAAPVAVLDANIDDMSPQHYELALERILAAGALDVWTTPIGMKKGRPAIMLSALAPLERESDVAQAMLRETTTIGIRVRTERRYVLPRAIRSVETPFGIVRVKEIGVDGTQRATLENDDVVRIARERDRPAHVIARELERWLENPS